MKNTQPNPCIIRPTLPPIRVSQTFKENDYSKFHNALQKLKRKPTIKPTDAPTEPVAASPQVLSTARDATSSIHQIFDQYAVQSLLTSNSFYPGSLNVNLPASNNELVPIIVNGHLYWYRK